MIRQHQFYKVELVSIVENDKCAEELERMSNAATMILDELKLPYRKIILCTGGCRKLIQHVVMRKGTQII